jgi:nitroimidazol reductase NimA-like FMN-containing flavoprotein (pyridoxamine 5'-phosphate oxidase superfamily)
MRRSQCEIRDPEEILGILERATIGRLATQDKEGYPYITPVNFVFHKGCIYFHSAPEGEKLRNMERDPRVCFEVDEPLAYLEVSFNPERSPCRTHQLYRCVLIRGTARVLPDGELKTEVLNALVAKHEKGRDFQEITPEFSAYRACTVVEIRPERMTAKADLLQGKPQELKAEVAMHLAGRGLPGDLEAVRAMGLDPAALGRGVGQS